MTPPLDPTPITRDLPEASYIIIFIAAVELAPKHQAFNVFFTPEKIFSNHIHPTPQMIRITMLFSYVFDDLLTCFWRCLTRF